MNTQGLMSISRRGFQSGLAVTCWSRLAASAVEAADSPAAAPRSAILLFLPGGLSHLDSFDPKPAATSEYRGQFDAIDTATPGLMVSDQMPQLAKQASRFAVLRSVSHPVRIHNLGVTFMLTGSRAAAAPAIGSIAARCVGGQVPPPYIAIPDLPARSGRLGPRFEPCNILGDTGTLIRATAALEGNARRQFERRAALLAQLDGGLARRGVDARSVETRRASYRQALELVGSEPMRRALDLDREPARVREAYGKHVWGEFLLLARRQIEHGARFVAVSCDDGDSTFGCWDMHRSIFPRMRHHLPKFDHALAALLEDLDQRGLLESTLVVVSTEFGRTPKSNSNAGRDHWPGAFSMLWAGAGVAAGTVVGKTDGRGEEVLEAPVTPGDVALTVLTQIGCDPHRLPVTPPLLPKAKRIEALFA